jgi:class 3 adenylate cyclase
MSAATIIFTDVVSFSKKPTAYQKKLVEGLNKEVINEIGHLLNSPKKSPNIIVLPTGDGLAITFLHKVKNLWDRSTLLNLIIRMHKWAFKKSTIDNQITLRAGVHIGTVEIFKDINNKLNVCGDTINYAQRVMDAANPRQTLFSETAFREYIGSESPNCILTSSPKQLTAKFFGPIEVFAKHKLQILVYKLTIKPEQSFCYNGDPIAKQLMLVTLTPLPKKIKGSFSESVKAASQLAFIQLTGERFFKDYKSGIIKLSSELNLFWVFMPDPEIYDYIKATNLVNPAKLVKEYISIWADLFLKLKFSHPKADFKIGLFKEPPYIGASFINWERPGGKIHISPYVWSIPAVNCPGYDMEWIGKKPSPVYEIYVQGLQHLNKTTENYLNL